MAFTITDNDVATVPARQSVWYQTDIDILTAGVGGVGVVSGCAVTAQGSPDMTVAIAAGVVRIASGAVVVVTSGNGTIATADATNPRIDLVSVSNAGVKTVTAGSAAASPKPPSLPSGHVALAFVDVPATDTTISTGQITDKRVVLPTANTADYLASSDTTMTSAATSYDAVSGSFAAGTWVILWKVLIQGVNTPASWFAKLWDGSTIYDESEGYHDQNGYRAEVAGFAIVTLAATATLKITAQSDKAGQIIKRDGGNGTIHATTRISGVRLY